MAIPAPCAREMHELKISTTYCYLTTLIRRSHVQFNMYIRSHSYSPISPLHPFHSTPSLFLFYFPIPLTPSLCYHLHSCTSHTLCIFRFHLLFKHCSPLKLCSTILFLYYVGLPAELKRQTVKGPLDSCIFLLRTSAFLHFSSHTHSYNIHSCYRLAYYSVSPTSILEKL